LDEGGEVSIMIMTTMPYPTGRVVFTALITALTVVSCGGGSDGGGSTGGMIDPGGAQASISSIQDRIFTPNCALSGCHAGPTPQPLQGAGMDLSEGNALDSLLGSTRSGVASTIDPSFKRIVDGDPINSYLYMKVVDDPRIAIALNLGVCSISTGSTCMADGDCPTGETCSRVGARMPKNAPELSNEEKSAIFLWIQSRVPGSTGPPGY
jgi:hypothetical protein